MHHERLDGGGYRTICPDKRIDVFARYIAAIIDAYIAALASRTYRNALTPLQVLGISKRVWIKYDGKIIDADRGETYYCRCQIGTTWNQTEASGKF